MLRNLIIAILFLSLSVFSQQNNEPIKVTGKTLFGKSINGESIREVVGNVVMIQGNVRITCDKAIQNITQNNAELIGSVHAVQDSIEIFTERGFYYGNQKYTYSYENVKLLDGSIVLTAKRGYYYFEEERAEFYENVKLVDSASTLTSDFLIYFEQLNKAVSVGNVKIADEKSEIFSDSLVHWRDTKLTHAQRNVKIISREDALEITGQKMIDDNQTLTTKISGNPELTKIDTTESGAVDTLFIKSDFMEAINDSTKKLIAEGNVHILRGGFSSVNDYSILFRLDDKIVTYQFDEEKRKPIMWFEESQLSGDSIAIYLFESELKQIDIFYDGLIVSKKEGYEYRFDQISGNKIKLMFNQRKLERTYVDENVLSIYFMFEEEEPNGLLKSSADSAKIFLENNKVKDVRLFGAVKSEYHPENLVVSKEQEFTLPRFVIHLNRPKRNDFIINKN
ncbi:MAG: LPS export ABC transporter periplasmic protein LptC [Bacteroidetes bacterium]|nr:LPS export ABC transporter periplasmic protein LptC [Bacteroidota bacterium]MBU1680508.1 LPS export ABC transporter periplasmic protein LptC [Bacteroidota bacterium]MBU2507556.1 LPS export ABC transporter periplasmic protein LptC [Bacteroidota bacterium]